MPITCFIRYRIDPFRRDEPRHVQRLLWIREQLELGHTQAAVAAALGLTPGGLSRIISLHGLQAGRQLPSARGLARILGVRIGSAGQAFDAAPATVQHRLLEIAAANEITIASAAMMVVAQKLATMEA